MARNFHNQDGFIALTSVIIISAILLILVAVVSTAGFFTRFNVLDYENKTISSALAEACVETALVNLAADPTNYPASIPVPAGKQITVDSTKTCRICSVSATTIKTRAAYNKAYTNLTVVGNLDASNFNVTSWDENLTGPAGCNLP